MVEEMTHRGRLCERVCLCAWPYDKIQTLTVSQDSSGWALFKFEWHMGL